MSQETFSLGKANSIIKFFFLPWQLKMIMLVSISSTFYAQLFCQYFGANNYKAERWLEKATQSTFVQKNLRLKCWWNWQLLSFSLSCKPKKDNLLKHAEHKTSCEQGIVVLLFTKRN